jgi:ABC-type polysaccharide/polyol phosphate transport system ATPase subunit
LASGTSIDQATTRTEPVPRTEPAEAAPVVIEAHDVDKTFRIPRHRIDSLKERAVHPLARVEYRELHALKQVSFDIHRGEFFGIVGRNGSGKSTLLKILASIYRADAGRIRMAGRVAPFIELGVGFNPDLTARQNIVLNGVMMGLPQREARRRLDAVLEFGELEDFADLKLKNYSSGMMVRLAFSVMIQSDADILLIDEVLAVGDAAFQQKCADVLREMREGDRTIVLVTHDMASVQAYCHRAMLIDSGELSYIGDPEEVARQYFRLNFARANGGSVQGKGLAPDVHARLGAARLENHAGEPIENVEVGDPIRLSIVIEAREELVQPVFSLHCVSAEGVEVFGLIRTLKLDPGEADRIAAGQQVRISGTIENPLTPGRYYISCWVARNRNPGDVAFQVINALDFVVFGQRKGPGVVAVRNEVEAVREPRSGE